MAKVIEMKGGWKVGGGLNLQANRKPLYPPRVRRILSCRPVQFRRDANRLLRSNSLKVPSGRGHKVQIRSNREAFGQGLRLRVTGPDGRKP
jgi:hypothetical protein